MEATVLYYLGYVHAPGPYEGNQMSRGGPGLKSFSWKGLEHCCSCGKPLTNSLANSAAPPKHIQSAGMWSWSTIRTKDPHPKLAYQALGS